MDTGTSTPRSKLSTFLLITLLGLIALAGIALVMVQMHEAGHFGGSLMLFDDDISDSVLGWMIALPILAFTMVLVVVILAGTGVFLVGIFAMLVVLAVVLAVFGIAMAVLPFAAFLAVPVMFVWMVVKLAQRKQAAQAA